MADFPLFERLIIESQALCNRSCWFCPRTFDASGKYLDGKGTPARGRMPTETIEDILDQAAALGFQGLVGFHHYSEPLLDPRSLDLAQSARERGMKPYVHTNGDRLRKDDELCRRAVEVYERIVVGLYDYTTREELAAEKAYWSERLAGADLRFSALGEAGPTMAIPRALVPPDDRVALPDRVYRNAPCHRPLVRMIIQHDGEMCNCCEDTHGAFKLGNIHESSLEELWYSPRHRKIAEDLVKGLRQNYDLCRRCPLSPTAPPPAGARLEMALRS